MSITRKKPFSYSQLLCASKQHRPTNLSEEEMEYVRITHTGDRTGHGVPSHRTTSTVTVVRAIWAFVGAVVLMAAILSPIPFIIKKDEPTPSPSPYPTMVPKVQCPDAGAAMFVGYTVSNTSEDRQLLLMVALTDLPERLELFLTNSFSLPTMSGINKTGSVKMTIPSGGLSTGTLFGYESPALPISDELMWQNSASGFVLPEQGSD
eukprot:scaffold11090_cov87-Attheya_sp.AAC.1